MRRPICLALFAAAAWPSSRLLLPQTKRSGSSTSTTGRTISPRTMLGGFHQGDRDQGPLRHLRFQRHAGDQAARRQVRLRRGGADGLFPRAPDQGRRVPEARQGQAAEPRQRRGRRSRSAWRATIPATSTPSTTCGARPASATTSRRRARCLGGDGKIDSWDIVFKPESWPSSRTAACTCSTPSDDMLAAALHYLGLDPNITRRRPICRRPPIS